MSEEHKTPNNIYIALASAQGEMGPAIKGATNPHFKSKYADLSDVMQVAIPALSKYGIAAWHSIVTSDGVDAMRTTLSHGESDTHITCDVPLIVSKNDMQGMKSATTYAKRIGIESLTGIAPEDDDGNAAQGGVVKRKSARQANDDKDFERLSKAITDCQTESELKLAWGRVYRELPNLPKTFETPLTELKDDKKSELSPPTESDGPTDDQIAAATHKDDILAQLKDCLNTDAIDELVDEYAQQLGDMENDHPDMHSMVMDEINKAKAKYTPQGRAAGGSIY